MTDKLTWTRVEAGGDVVIDSIIDAGREHEIGLSPAQARAKAAALIAAADEVERG